MHNESQLNNFKGRLTEITRRPDQVCRTGAPCVGASTNRIFDKSEQFPAKNGHKQTLGEFGLIHTGRATHANGTCCCEWECSHCTEATSKDLRSNLRARVLCGLGLMEGLRMGHEKRIQIWAPSRLCQGFDTKRIWTERTGGMSYWMMV